MLVAVPAENRLETVLHPEVDRPQLVSKLVTVSIHDESAVESSLDAAAQGWLRLDQGWQELEQSWLRLDQNWYSLC